MGSSSSKQSRGNKESRAKKNLKAAERLEHERHSDHGVFHREPNYEKIRRNALGRAQEEHDTRISQPMPGKFPDMPQHLPVYHTRVSDRRPPTPPGYPRMPSPVYSHESAIPAPLTIRKQPRDTSGRQMFSYPAAGAPSRSTSRPTGSSSRKQMFTPPTAAPSSSQPLPNYMNSSTVQKGFSSSRQPQSDSSRRHGPSTARNPPSSDRAPPPLSSRNYLPRNESRQDVAPPARSGRRRVTRDDVRRR